MASARRPINPMLLTCVILLVMATLLFTGLLIHTSNSIKTTIEGNPEDTLRRDALSKLEDDVRKLRGEVQQIEDDLDTRDHEIRHLNLDLERTLTYFDAADHLIAGIDGQTTPEGQKTKQSNWWLTRELVTRSVQGLQNAQKEHESPDRQTFPALEKAIASRNDEIQAVMQRSNEIETAYKTDKDRLSNQLEMLNAEKAKAEKAKAGNYSKRATRINQRENDIRKALELELHWVKELEGDGQIIETGAENGFVIINLGQDDQVFPGLLFEVFQYDHGKYVEKGKIEVIDVRSRISTCRILNELDKRHFPLANNDYIGNPVFGSRKPKVFFLDGDFKRYNKPDLQAFIRATGGIVRDSLGPGVDFLIAGDKSDKQQDNAREYQIQAMTEDQLLKYVQPNFAVKTAAAPVK